MDNESLSNSDRLAAVALKRLRSEIGASLLDIAEILGLSGDHAEETVRQMENQEKPISDTLCRILKFMQQGTPDPAIGNFLPEYMICTDLAEQMDIDWIYHTRYPRFLAVVTEKQISEIDSHTLDGADHITVGMWIDKPVSDPEPYLRKAAELYFQHTRDALGSA